MEEPFATALEEAANDFIEALGEGSKVDPFLEVSNTKRGLLCSVYRFEADEMWSFVGKKENKQWIWLVMHTANRQIIAFHVGGRGQAHAQLLWQKIPLILQEQACFFTDFWKAYALVIDAHQQRAKSKALLIILKASIIPCGSDAAD